MLTRALLAATLLVLVWPSARRRADLRLAGRQRHAGPVRPVDRSADGRLRGRGRSQVRLDDSGGVDVRPRAVRAVRLRVLEQAVAAARAGARGHSGRVRLQPARAVAKGRDGTDAAHAGHRADARRAAAVRPRAEHSRRDQVPAAAARQVPRATKSSRSPPTTPGPAPSIATARRFPRIGKPGTTCARSDPPRAKRRPPPGSCGSTRPSKSSTAARSPATPARSPHRAASKSSAADPRTLKRSTSHVPPETSHNLAIWALGVVGSRESGVGS